MNRISLSDERYNTDNKKLDAMISMTEGDGTGVDIRPYLAKPGFGFGLGH